MRSIAKPRLLISAITVVALAPFLAKPFHIDDPLFIWIARQIAKHPLDPYGFHVNWSSFVQPMWEVMQNPPLCSYYIAAVANAFGWSEIALHIGFLVPAVAAALGAFAVARRFCEQPFIAALLVVFTPVFLISATNVMCDVMMLAGWLWAIEFWFAGLETSRTSRFFFSALIIAAAALTKYFAAALVPLLAVYTIARERRFRWQLLFLVLPIAAIAAYDFATQEKYGVGLFSAASSVSSSVSAATRPSIIAETLMGLAFTGGCLITTMFAAAPKKFIWLIAFAIVAIVAAVAFKFFILSWAFVENGENVVAVEGGIFAAIAVAALALAIGDFVRRRTLETLFLLFWIVGTFAFVTFFNWSVTARTVLPLAPPIAIVVARRLTAQRTWPIAAAAALSLILALADYHAATSAKNAAQFFQSRFGSEPSRVRFLGHWGFQFYMQQWGASAFDRKHPEVNSGDVIVGPLIDPMTRMLPLEKMATREQFAFPALPFVATAQLGTGASFYSSFGGPLPWAVNEIPPARYYALRAR